MILKFLGRSLLLFALVPAALAVMIGYEPPKTEGDPHFEAAVAAFEEENWQGVIDNLASVIERRPWNDDAHNLTGYAYRKLGNYPRSLEHYRIALELNPHNRGALEYLGEAYLELDRPDDARAMLARLETECRRLAEDPEGEGWREDCPEWRDLKTALDAYREESR